MTYPGPADPALREQWRRERRAVVRRHHPDRGGDPDAMTGRLNALDNQYRRLDQPHLDIDFDVDQAAPVWQPAARVVRRAQRNARHLARAARARIPAGWPGHRHYIDL